MKHVKLLTAAITAGVALALTPAPADAHGRKRSSVHFSVGVWGPAYWGPHWGPYWGGYWARPGWGYPGYWGPSTVVVVPREPQVYIERDPAADAATPPPASPSPAANAPQWWYWCASARQYYPYVATCSEGWQRVPPQPAQAR